MSLPRRRKLSGDEKVTWRLKWQEHNFSFPLLFWANLVPKTRNSCRGKNLLCASSFHLPFSPFILGFGYKSSSPSCLLLSAIPASLLFSPSWISNWPWLIHYAKTTKNPKKLICIKSVISSTAWLVTAGAKVTGQLQCRVGVRLGGGHGSSIRWPCC